MNDIAGLLYISPSKIKLFVVYLPRLFAHLIWVENSLIFPLATNCSKQDDD